MNVVCSRFLADDVGRVTIVAQLHDAVATVRAASLEAIGLFGLLDHRTDLLASWGTRTLVRYSAILGLTALAASNAKESPGIVAKLISFSFDSDEEVRTAAIRAILKSDHNANTDRCRKDNSPRIRSSCIRALGERTARALLLPRISAELTPSSLPRSTRLDTVGTLT
jgi:HEAT repeat protein